MNIRILIMEIVNCRVDDVMKMLMSDVMIMLIRFMNRKLF